MAGREYVGRSVPAGEHRHSVVERGLAFRFTLLTWLTIAPAVALGLAVTAVFAYLYLDLVFAEMFWVMLVGALAMLVTAVPGQMMWRAAFKRRVLDPLRDLGAVMLQAGSGDLTTRTTVDTDDEIGLLAQECNALIASLEAVARQVRSSAESVSGAAGRLSVSSQEMNSSTMEISSSVQQIAHGAELQSRKVEETSAAMETIASHVGETARQAEDASRASGEAARFALEGEEATDEAIRKIEEVRQAIETLAESVSVLGERSTEIGSIVDVITSIAEQTNLLSLNAAIEAARAGESGRGFSVVAEEVRKLADGSAKAAERIADLVKDVQTETSKAVEYMEIGAHEVLTGTEVVSRSGDSLRKISDAVSRTAMLAERIARSTAEQSDKTASVDKAMHDIAAVVEQNAASAQETAAAAQEQTACMEQVSASAQELADMSERLEDAVRRFRVE